MKQSKIIALTSLSCMILSSDAAEVRVTGLDEALTKTMSAKIQPRLEFIGQRSATEWRADDASFFLKELLIKQGYSDCKVNWELSGNDTILLKTELGPQFVLGKISTTGKDPLSEKLIDQYFSEIITDSKIISRSKAPYLEDYPEKGAKNIANYLKSQGYWDATVSVVSIKKQSTGQVDIQLNIQRGNLHHILPPTFSGINTQGVAAIKTAVAPHINKPATSQNIATLSNTVRDYYRDQGYQFANIDISSKNLTGILINYDIQTGNLYTVRDFNVSGNIITKPSRFSRYLSPLRGEQYTEADTNEVVKKLLLTGAFKSVRIIPKKINGSEIDLHLEVTEAKPRFIRAYTGVASFDGFVLGASYTNQNFLNKLQTFTVRSEISSRGLLGEVSLTEPYFAGVPVSFTTRLFALQRQFDGYDKKQSGLETSFTWKPNDSLTSRLYAGLDYVTLEADGITPQELGPDDYINTKVGFEQTLDLRNNPVLPTQGFHAKGTLEYGRIDLDTSSSYFQTTLNTSYRHLLQNEQKSRLIFRFNAAAIYPADSEELPIDLRLFSGGIDSIRSFAERELGPLSASGDPLGGEAYWNASAEYIHPFNDLVSASIFYDTGNLFSNTSDFSFSNPNHTLGIGIRLDLPVGPARFEYGYNLNQQPGEASGAFHFAIGAQF